MRPTELLTNFFGRRTQQKQENVNIAFSGNRLHPPSSQSNNPVDGGVSLIDLSPPGSPTFTTRSNSDGVSVDSFGSDGNSNPSAFTSSGNTSQTESAFEDDFDFFGSLSNTNKAPLSDPWKSNGSHDPFSPVPAINGNATKRIGDSTRFFAYNDTQSTTTTTSRTAFDTPFTNPPSTTMPTIIRARPPKPPAPKSLYRGLAPTVTDFTATAMSSSSFSTNKSKQQVPSVGSAPTIPFTVETEWPDNFRDNTSPPMPSIPPPAPPSEYFTSNSEASAVCSNYQFPSAIYA